MDRTFVCNLQQFGSLLVRQRPAKLNVAFDSIERSFFCFALGAIGGVDFRVPKMDRHLRERPCFAPGIHCHGHRSTCPQSGEQEIVGRRAGIRSAGGYRFVGMETMRARVNFLRESGGAAAHNHTSNIMFFHSPARFKCSSLTSAHADACWLRCRNASSSALTWSLRVEHMPCGAPGMTFSVAPLTNFEERSAESAIGTIWSSSP